MNRLERIIGEIKFYKELFSCQLDEDEMSIDLFSLHVDDFIQCIREEFNVLLNRVMSDDGITVEMDTIFSDDHRLVFYNVDNENEKYALVDNEVRSMSAFSTAKIGAINACKREEISKILDLYRKIIFKAFNSSKEVPLTSKLSFNYSLLSGCYYFLSNKDGGFVIIERKEGLEENQSDVIFIDRVRKASSVNGRYIYEFIEVKKLVRELLDEVKEELNITIPTNNDVNEEIEAIIKQ